MSFFCVAAISLLTGTIQPIEPAEKNFYAKRLDYDGIPIKASAEVSDAALIAARQRLDGLLCNLPEARKSLGLAGAELHIIAKTQGTSDLPEHRHWKGKLFDGSQTLDQRTRGLGGLLASCGEENLLKLDEDRYKGSDICVHEFAHTLFDYGISESIRTSFHLQRLASLAQKRWVNSYAGSNDNEFFAELSMWYFGTHGHLGMTGAKPALGREGLKAYDPEAFQLMDNFYHGRLVVPVIPSAQELFPQGDVRLLDGPFKTMQDFDHAYLLRLEPDRLLAQFRVEAGLEPKAKPYGGWESPAQPGKTWSLAGHTLGHYLSAASLMVRMTDDPVLKERVTYLVRELKVCQDKRGDGSLVAFPYFRELVADIRSNKVETIDKYWAPFYTIHKEMAGLRDAWLWCNDAEAKEVLVRMADWCGSLVKDLSDERRERLLNSEHGGMAEVLADVYAITGKKEYLATARLYSHRALLDPAAAGTDNLTGKHANTQIPKFIGFQRIHELGGDAPFGAAAAFFWKTVVGTRSWLNGANSIHEHFPAVAEMAETITHDGGPETCNTYNMLKLTAALYREKPEMALVDYYENALFNHILASQAPRSGAGAFVYYTPLRPDFARSYGSPFTCFWCCTGTGMENHAKYGEFIYSHTAETLSVNLFLASTLDWSGSGLRLRQETRFPEEAATTLIIEDAPAEPLTLRVRRPSWLATPELAVTLNDKSVTGKADKEGYVVFTQVWKAGDRLHVALPMSLRVARQPQCPGWLALFNGPILLAGELGAEGLEENDFIARYTPLKAMRPLDKAPVIVAPTDAEILARIKPVANEPGVFKTADLVKPGDLTLKPFYKVHFQRYAIYWQQSTAADWETRRQRLAAEEAREQKENARTVDRVRIGEQQPEIDHNLLSEKSSTNTGPQNRRWRDARDGGWFSYEMKLPVAGTPAAVQACYWRPDGGRTFDILVDNTVIATQKLEGGKEGFFTVEYPLPTTLTADKTKVTVRIQARPGEMAGGIYDLRIMTPEPHVRTP